MNNQIQIVLKSSTTEMSLNDHEAGIYIIPDLDGLTGLPEIRTTSGVNAGYDGGWTTAQNYDARSITLRGVIANSDVATVERLRKQLVTLLGQGKNEQLIFDIVTQAGNAYELMVRTIDCEMAMQRVLTQQEFMIQLRADDPLIYDNTAGSESVLVQVQRAIGGFEINFELPLAISGGSGESVIENAGLEKVYPVIKMYGELHNPIFVNLTTNQQIQLNTNLAFADGDTETKSGNPISISNAVEAPLNAVSIYGNTSQTGTPTPSAPVEVQTVSGEQTISVNGDDYKVNLGKNLIKLTPTTFNANGVDVTVDSDGTITLNGTASAQYNQSNKIEIENLPVLSAGETLTYSVFYVSGTIDDYATTGLNLRTSATTTGYEWQLNSSTIQMRMLNQSTTFTMTDTGSSRRAGYVTHAQIYFPQGRVFDNLKYKLQLEYGSTSTAYADYVPVIELCKIGDYQDYIYKDGSDWKVHKAVGEYTFDGSEDWIRSGRTTASVFVAAVSLTSAMIEWKIGNDYKALAKSDRFKPSSATAIGNFDLYNGTDFYTSLALYFDITTIPDLAAAKSWITANTPTVYAILAAPTDTTITNSALIEQLEAVLAANTQTGVNSITLTPSLGETGSLAVTYYTSSPKRDEVIIDSRKRTVTLNGTDIYHLIADGSEFPILAPGENKLVLHSDITGDNGYAEVNYKQGYLSI